VTVGKNEHGRRGRRRRMSRVSAWRWKRAASKQLQWVEFAVDCAAPIVPEIIRSQVPAGVDLGRLIEVLELARAAGLGAVEAGVVGQVSRDGAFMKGRALPESWWAEARGRDGQVLGVDDHGSLADALAALVRATPAGRGLRRIPIEWVEGMGSGGPSTATHRATVVSTEVTERGVDVELTSTSAVSVPEVMLLVNEAATRALNRERTFLLQCASDDLAPIRLEPGGLVLLHAERKPVRVVGFVRDAESADLDVDLPAFYSDPQKVIGLRLVFTVDDRGPWHTCGPIVSVRTTRDVVQ
jgi:hypothetical protein